jgi:hypothetical protein
MNNRDIGSELTWKLSAILEDCKRIEPILTSYLRDTDDRPEISAELLRVLSNALGAYELLQPDKLAGEFHGLPREACTSDEDPQLAIRHLERPADWDFQPWLLEKLNAMQSAAKRLVKEWLTDLNGIRLRADAPMTPKEWLRSGIMMHFRELQGKAKTVFEEVCSDKLQIHSRAEQ